MSGKQSKQNTTKMFRRERKSKSEFLKTQKKKNGNEDDESEMSDKEKRLQKILVRKAEKAERMQKINDRKKKISQARKKSILTKEDAQSWPSGEYQSQGYGNTPQPQSNPEHEPTTEKTNEN